MKRVLALALAAAFVYAASRALLRPRASERAADEPVASRPARKVEVPVAAAPQEPQGSWESSVDKPNVRTLKIADVPPPGAERTPEQVVAAAAADAAARAPALGGGGYGIPGVSASASPIGDRRSSLGGRDEAASEREAGAPKDSAAPPPRKASAGLAAPAADGKTPKAAGEDGSWTGQTAGLLKTAKSLSLGKRDPEAAALLKLANDPVGQRLLVEQKASADVRQALARLRESGRAVTREEEEQAVAQALAQNGIEPQEEDVTGYLALADAPPAPPVPPQRFVEILDDVKGSLPPSQELERLARQADKPRPRHAPPPRSARRAYESARDVLNAAKERWKVDPEYPLSILGVESAYGQHTGQHNVSHVLYGELKTRKPDSFRYRLAQEDLAALVRLEARDDLGGYTAATIKGSHGAAFGLTQFRPSTWERYARAPDGGKRDPFDLRTALNSTAHHLYRHRYGESPRKAIWHYNQSDEYYRDVRQGAEGIRESVIAPSRP